MQSWARRTKRPGRCTGPRVPLRGRRTRCTLCCPTAAWRRGCSLPRRLPPSRPRCASWRSVQAALLHSSAGPPGPPCPGTHIKGLTFASGLQSSFAQLWDHSKLCTVHAVDEELSCSSARPKFEVEESHIHYVLWLVFQDASFLLSLCADCAEEGSFPVRAQGSSHGPPTLASSAWGS